MKTMKMKLLLLPNRLNKLFNKHHLQFHLTPKQPLLKKLLLTTSMIFQPETLIKLTPLKQKTHNKLPKIKPLPSTTTSIQSEMKLS